VEARKQAVEAKTAAPAELKDEALPAGLYVARIHDNVFELDTPDDFAR
jgi:hypothetical protein